MALSIGVELSYLNEQRQRDVLEQCEINACTPSYSQAVRLKKLFQNQQLTSLDIQQIWSEEKPNQQEVMKISAERLQAVLPQGLNAAETEDHVIKACEHYRKFQRRANRNDEVQHRTGSLKLFPLAAGEWIISPSYSNTGPQVFVNIGLLTQRMTELLSIILKWACRQEHLIHQRL